jgi:hypothetical protein
MLNEIGASESNINHPLQWLSAGPLDQKNVLFRCLIGFSDTTALSKGLTSPKWVP